MELPYFHEYIRFSQNISQKRLNDLSKFIDSKTINRILSLALFLLGGDRIQISNYIRMPVGTFFSFLTRLSKEGIRAFFDKRSKYLPEMPLPVIDEHAQKKTNLEISFGEIKIQIDCDETMPGICIDSTNPLQFKTLILTLVQSGIVKPQQASTLLQISQRYVRQLCTDLKQNDIEAIIDRRKGQKGDFAFTSNVKAELIQQYTAHVVSGGPTTSSHIARQVNKACNTTLSERTFRHHIAKMGLDTIKHSLPRLLSNFKKKLNNIISESQYFQTIISTTSKQKLTEKQKKHILERGKIISLFKAGKSFRQISVFVDRHISTVKRWIKRALSEQGSLQDRPRIGHPLTFTERIQLKITAFFCQANPLPGCLNMSLKTAVTYFNNKVSFLGRTISKSTISRILKKHSLRPHLHKYFLQITDPQFFSKMALLVNLYLKRPKYLFCFDECPGLQALKRLAPSLQAKKGYVKLSEPNHNRMGTTDLYAFLDVNTGKIFGVCTQNHKVKTLIRVFKRHFKSLPIMPKDKDTVIYYICDNLSNHSCHEFCRFIAKLCEIKYPEKKLNTKQKRQEWLQCENKKIVISFTPKHGSWLNMVEIWFGVLSKMCLKHNSFDSVAQLKTVIERFMKTWNKYFAHPFQWKYKGEGLHGKAVRRFIQHISIENPDMKEGFLCTQIELMIELFKNNFRAVDIFDWKLLAKTIEEKKSFVDTCIQNAKKPRIKKKLLIFFPQLMQLLIENNFLKYSIAA